MDDILVEKCICGSIPEVKFEDGLACIFCPSCGRRSKEFPICLDGSQAYGFDSYQVEDAVHLWNLDAEKLRKELKTYRRKGNI